MNKINSNSILLLSIFLGGVACSNSTNDTADTENTPPSLDGWTLKWSDEFEGASGEGPDPATWSHDVGGHGWGNNQLEYNTDRTDNAQLDGKGTLWLRATKEQYSGNAYTSARIKTEGLQAFGHGRLEARIRVPSGKGIWPAFWMLGEQFSSIGWPNCGEIDILELRGSQPSLLYGTLHGPGYSGGSAVGDQYHHSTGLNEDFHVYAIERTENQIRWYLDDVLFSEKTPADLPGGSEWVFEQDFWILLNIAVGGHFVEAPDATTPFPALMGIDYVRFYEPED
jgi:beta-glucanase (GH16 family)